MPFPAFARLTFPSTMHDDLSLSTPELAGRATGSRFVRFLGTLCLCPA
jgi:hypothetical protein